MIEVMPSVTCRLGKKASSFSASTELSSVSAAAKFGKTQAKSIIAHIAAENRCLSVFFMVFSLLMSVILIVW